MLQFEGLHVKHEVQCGILGTNSAFALGPRKTAENLDRVCIDFRFKYFLVLSPA
jgi:hypothetical protein